MIASGGAGNLEHLYEGLTEGAASAVLAASIFHFREVTIGQGKVVSARTRSCGPMNGHSRESAKFGADGLIPAVVQDAHTREVLTVAYMNKEALQLTLETSETYFWSRSRQQLWHKGETSGNSQKVTKVSLDCDHDAVLVEVEPSARRATRARIRVSAWNRDSKASCRSCTRVIEERKGTAARRKLHDVSVQQRPRQDFEEGRRRSDGDDHRGQER